MKLIGFNFTNISAQKHSPLKSKPSVNTNIEFIDVSSEKIQLLKESTGLSVSFKFTVNYTDGETKKEVKYGHILFEGKIILAATDDESQETIKNWKKKALPQTFQAPLFNIILKRCTSKALALEEELGLPPHIPIPQVQISKKTE